MILYNCFHGARALDFLNKLFLPEVIQLVLLVLAYALSKYINIYLHRKGNSINYSYLILVFRLALG